MELGLTSVLLGASAVLCAVLGAIVFLRNPRRSTNIAFTVLAINQLFWALGVLAIINANSAEQARFWVVATFLAACYLPVSFYTFIGYFPRGHFDGSKLFLVLLYMTGTVLAILALTPGDHYVRAITMVPRAAPAVSYGPLFEAMSVEYVTIFLVMHANLFRKFRRSGGIERRQIQHVFLGIFTFTLFAILTNILAPLVGIQNLEPYGPVFTVLMTGFFAYAILRYHLLDIWVIISRTTVYAVTSGVVVLVFLGSIAVVHWTFRNFEADAGIRNLGPTILAALVIVLVLEPLKSRVQLLLDRVVVRRRYDINQLLARASKNAAKHVQLDQLLKSVCDDIYQTVGASVVRVLLVDERDHCLLTTEYSTRSEECGMQTREYGELIEYLRKNPEPLILEQIIHDRMTPEHARLAGAIAEMDSYMCVPLRHTGDLVGIMNLGQKVSRDIYTAEDVVAFTALSSPLATAIENARLYRKLEEANQHRARILSNMRGGVIAVDVHGVVTTVNHWAQEILGKVELGQPLSDTNQQLLNILHHTLTDRRPILDYETVVQRVDGERIPVVISSSVLTAGDDENAVTGAMVVIYDLTQVKRLEQNVQRAHRLSSVGTLAAGMAHEIKNPLVSIKTFSQLLPLRYDDPDFRHTFTDIVPHEVERIDSIVTRLLHFARPKPATFAPQDLRGIIEEVLVLVENQLRKGNITVETDFPGPNVPIYGDEQQLHQVFLNLVLNAIDAMRDCRSGMLRIRVDYDRKPMRRGVRGPYPEIDCVKVAVTDTGCGISAESMERIFMPFYTTKDEGTGLGLSVVHGIVTEHGGTIYVESNPGQETTFIITLPVAHRMTEVKGA